MSTSWAIERRSEGPADTEALAERLGAACEGGELLVLSGELGAGKTVFVRGLARGLGCAPRDVRSPSYTLLHRYEGRLVLNHFDVYFTHAWADLERSPLVEYLQAGEVAAVEWGERFDARLPEDRLEISLHHDGPQSRRLRLRARGTLARQLLERSGLGLLADRPASAEPGPEEPR